MKFKKVYLLIILAVTILSCKEKVKQGKINTGDNIYLKREYYSTSKNIKNEFRYLKDSLILGLVFNKNRKLFSIITSQEDSVFEILAFHPNGKLKSKVSFSSRSKKENGKSYYFYESGVLRSERNSVNGKYIDRGYDYYDSSGVVKTILFYNQEGNLISRITYDKKGEEIKREGTW